LRINCNKEDNIKTDLKRPCVLDAPISGRNQRWALLVW